MERAFGREWDRRTIFTRLEVGGWPSVGRTVLNYIWDRLQ